MKSFMSNVWLENETANNLYDKIKDTPIYDFHCHLSPKEIYEDKRYSNLTQLWLTSDHYKWRIMRAFGISENKITGKASEYEKFEAFCEALPYFMGNPVYHWAHLELKKYFNITLPICKENAKEIWDSTAKYMQEHIVSPRSLLEISNVKTLITTDDPCDNLEYHKLIEKENLPFNVFPCFRSDKVIDIANPNFNDYLEKLSLVSNVDIIDFDSLFKAIEKRILYFLERNCICVDLSIQDFPKGKGNFHIAEEALKLRLKGEKISRDSEQEYMFCVVAKMADIFSTNDMVLQMHVGPMRNCSFCLHEVAGVDAGGDSIANSLNIENAKDLLDYIDINSGLPKTIIFTLNPNAYYPLATLIGSFQGGEKGKLQLGAAWWFLDHKDGIYEQLKINASTGGLGLWVGMLTDSRSFSSYARHDYFRRILCSLIGYWIESGEYATFSKESLEEIVKGICYYNAKKYFQK